MAIDQTEIKNLCGSIINATRNAGISVFGNFAGDDFDVAFNSEEFTAAVKLAVRQIAAAILDTPGHRRRADFLELRTVTSGELVTSPIGAVIVDGKPGVKISASRFRRYKENFAATVTAPIGGYFLVEGHVVHFVGITAQVEAFKDLTDNEIDQLAPVEYSYLVAVGALAILFPKQGTNVEAANHFANLWGMGLKMIKEGAVEITAETQFGNKA